MFDKNIAPKWLESALTGGNVEGSLTEACKKAPMHELERAHQAIYAQHTVYRDAIMREINSRNEKASLYESMKANRLAVLAIIIALIALAVSIFK